MNYFLPLPELPRPPEPERPLLLRAEVLLAAFVARPLLVEPFEEAAPRPGPPLLGADPEDFGWSVLSLPELFLEDAEVFDEPRRVLTGSISVSSARTLSRVVSLPLL